MALAEDIETLLVVGNSVVVRLSFQPGTDYAGVVARVAGGDFELRGEILNPQAHFSNESADPIYRTRSFKIAEIASIRVE